MDDDGSSSVTAHDLVAQLEASRDELMQSLAGLNEEGLRARAAPATWSPVEVLTHLLLSEQKLLERAQGGRGDGHIVTPNTDAKRQDAAKRAQGMAVPQVLHGLLAQRRDTMRLLERLTAQDLARPVRRPPDPDATVARLFGEAAAHEIEHAEQIRAVRAVTGARTA